MHKTDFDMCNKHIAYNFQPNGYYSLFNFLCAIKPHCFTLLY